MLKHKERNISARKGSSSGAGGNFLTFQKSYFLAALFLFIAEVFIAVFIQDRFIRPYGGDFLVVFFLFCTTKAFLKVSSKKAILGVLLFSYLVEFLQYLNLVEYLGLVNNKVASVVLGSSFEWLDMLIYSLAASTLLLLEQAKKKGI